MTKKKTTIVDEKTLATFALERASPTVKSTVILAILAKRVVNIENTLEELYRSDFWNKIRGDNGEFNKKAAEALLLAENATATAAAVNTLGERLSNTVDVLTQKFNAIKAAKDGPPGKHGKDGGQGPVGPAPDHEVKGAKVRFKKPDGKWGAWLEAPQGEPGKNGGIVMVKAGGGSSGTDLAKLLPGNESAEPAAVAVLQGGQWVSLPWAAFTALAGTGDTSQARRIDFVGDSILYRGEAAPGTADSAPAWRIKRIEFTPGPDGKQDVSETWAGGTADFVHAWTDHETLEYL